MDFIADKREALVVAISRELIEEKEFENKHIK
jgi:hypothetical protein